MGMHPKGKVFYGYDVGGGEGDWKFTQAQESDTNPYGYLKTPWYDPEGDQDGEDVRELITKVLYDAIPGAPAVEYDWQRDEPVKEHYGVWLESHAHCDYPSYVLITHETTACQGDAVLLDLTELAATAQREDWDGKLAQALEVLQVTPIQEEPGWLLATDWG